MELIKPNEKKLIEEYYREKFIKKLKKKLDKLLDYKKYKNYDEQEKGFQNGWNNAIESIRDNEIDEIE